MTPCHPIQIPKISEDEIWNLFGVNSRTELYVSNYGRAKIVFSNGLERLKSFCLLNGYLVCAIRLDNKPKLIGLHQLVAQSFIETDNISSEIDHIDGNRFNNHVSNLRYIQNHKEQYNKEIKPKMGITPFKIEQLCSKTHNIMKIWGSARDVSNAFGITQSSVYRWIKESTESRNKTGCFFRKKLP